MSLCQASTRCCRLFGRGDTSTSVGEVVLIGAPPQQCRVHDVGIVLIHQLVAGHCSDRPANIVHVVVGRTPAPPDRFESESSARLRSLCAWPAVAYEKSSVMGGALSQTRPRLVPFPG